MAKRLATLSSPLAVRARLQAALFHAREQRLARQGSSAAVPVISSATPTGGDVDVVGTSVSGALIIVYVDGTESARARADAAGDWTATVTGLASGTYNFTATVTSYGMTSAATVAEEVVIA